MISLSEAARTRRRFRRTSEPDTWYQLQQDKIMVVATCNGLGVDQVADIDHAMVLAMDWEVEPKRILISAVDLLDVAKALNNNPIYHQRRIAPIEFMKAVIEELGLQGEA